MPQPRQAANAVSSSGTPELAAYKRAKREYHEAGKAAKGTAFDSPERLRYAQAKDTYRLAGQQLRESRVRS